MRSREAEWPKENLFCEIKCSWFGNRINKLRRAISGMLVKHLRNRFEKEKAPFFHANFSAISPSPRKVWRIEMRSREAEWPKEENLFCEIKCSRFGNRINKLRRTISGMLWDACEAPPTSLREVIRHESHHKDIRVRFRRNAFLLLLFVRFETSRGGREMSFESWGRRFGRFGGIELAMGRLKDPR
ncbi:hypothetical protein CEXT_322591 [Caerostris extrusa]|uniref:Uncharacterized protein n=1 Tax=Caerostris extrusa TaxID=172846 RepID=A0AAV4W3B3_CAEEX|nr:hypothetical protein CEXT_322591 [Caerostris extrusa]